MEPDEPRLPGLPQANDPAVANREYHTIVFFGSNRHEDLLRLVRELVDPNAQLAYTTRAGVCAVIVSEETRAEWSAIAAKLRARAQRLDPQLELELQTTQFRPYVLSSLVGRGPDGQRFELTAVPATTRAEDVGAAVMSNYADRATRDRGGRLRRIVIDHIRRNGSTHRMRQDASLGEQEVEDGDTLSVAPESTAGVGPGLRAQAIARARTQVAHYAESRPGFRVVSMFPGDFPTQYEFEFDAPGFAPPHDLAAMPLVPVDRETHRFTVRLPDDFPMKAPVVQFQTPMFHPNVLRDPPAAEASQAGFVCLGVLQEQYTPALDFGLLCDLIIDLASYQTYELRAVHEDGEGLGYLDAYAVAWAKSEAGQQRIAERGGSVRIVGQPEANRRRMPLLIQPMDESDGD